MEQYLIATKIHEMRGQKVIFDFDIAELYGVETKVLNQAVSRNKSRFPEDFMFRVNELEWESIRSQIVTGSKRKRNNAVKPFAFNEHGISMLASVLRSETAVKMNIAIIRAFVAMRKTIIDLTEISGQLEFLKDRIANHDVQLNEIYSAIENLLDNKAEQKHWGDRERIGFKEV